MPEGERAQAVRDRGRRPRASLGHDHRREGALQARHHVGDRVLDAVGLVGGEQRGDDLRVRGRAERHAPLAQLGVQLDRVDEVAVVGEGELAAVGAVDRLRVLPRARAGGGVADVAERHLARQRAQLLLVEDLADEAEVAQGHDVAVLGGGDARRLLPAVLKRVQREVREAGDVVLGGVRRRTRHTRRAVRRGGRWRGSSATGGPAAVRDDRKASLATGTVGPDGSPLSAAGPAGRGHAAAGELGDRHRERRPRSRARRPPTGPDDRRRLPEGGQRLGGRRHHEGAGALSEERGIVQRASSSSPRAPHRPRCSTPPAPRPGRPRRRRGR